MNHHHRLQKIVPLSMTIILALVFLLGNVRSAVAQDNKVATGGNAQIAPATAQGPSDAAELDAFLSALLTNQMKEYHIPGAAVAVVKDGKLFFAKGYGFADLQEGIAVDPEQTLFAIGSVGKLFTWTAVMQQVEQGKLNLDADINNYLDFRIPDTYLQPITLKHLLTHTSGFENRLLGSIVSDASEVLPARDWLVANMSARVRPPGEYTGYANYNAMLAGYIVARVSGQPYDQYIQEHILNPLGMAHSTASSPLPLDLRAHASEGYTYANGNFQTHPDYTIQPALAPSGALQASVTDMARFMIAHLQDGRYGDANLAETRILKESTAQQMHSTLYSADPRLLGTAYGFFHFDDNGQRALGHTGYSKYTNSLLLLLPDQNLGVFAIYNSMGGGELNNQHTGFQRAFFDHYYTAPAVAPIQPQADFAQRAARFVGSYRQTMSSYTTADKIGGLFGAVEISAPGDGTLLFTIPQGQWRFVEAAPLYFRQVDGPLGMVFREDAQGRITHMVTDLVPQYATVKLDWYETPGFNLALFTSTAMIFLSMFPAAAIRFIQDRRLSGKQKPASRGARAAYALMVAISILNLLVAVYSLLWGYPVILFAFSTMYKVVLALGVLSALLTVGALLYTLLAWKNSYWGIATRVYYTLVTGAAVAFVWFLHYWNLLGWRF